MTEFHFLKVQVYFHEISLRELLSLIEATEMNVSSSLTVTSLTIKVCVFQCQPTALLRASGFTQGG